MHQNEEKYQQEKRILYLISKVFLYSPYIDAIEHLDLDVYSVTKKV